MVRRMDRILKKHSVDVKSNGEDIIDEPDHGPDPIAQLGYGYQAYFDSLYRWGCVFTLITIIMLPALGIYAKNGGLLLSSHGYYNSVFMLGNLGFNKAVCSSDYVQLNSTRNFGCAVGVMSDLKYAGIIPGNLTYEDDTSRYYGFCGAANNTSPPDGAYFPA